MYLLKMFYALHPMHPAFNVQTIEERMIRQFMQGDHTNIS